MVARYPDTEWVAGAHPSRVHVYVVQPGDTLWRIAVRLYPGEDPRRAVYALKTANHLSDATRLVPGERLMWVR